MITQTIISLLLFASANAAFFFVANLVTQTATMYLVPLFPFNSISCLQFVIATITIGLMNFAIIYPIFSSKLELDRHPNLDHPGARSSIYKQIWTSSSALNIIFSNCILFFFCRVNSCSFYHRQYMDTGSFDFKSSSNISGSWSNVQSLFCFFCRPWRSYNFSYFGLYDFLWLSSGSISSPSLLTQRFQRGASPRKNAVMISSLCFQFFRWFGTPLCLIYLSWWIGTAAYADAPRTELAGITVNIDYMDWRFPLPSALVIKVPLHGSVEVDVGAFGDKICVHTHVIHGRAYTIGVAMNYENCRYLETSSVAAIGEIVRSFTTYASMSTVTILKIQDPLDQVPGGATKLWTQSYYEKHFTDQYDSIF